MWLYTVQAPNLFQGEILKWLFVGAELGLSPWENSLVSDGEICHLKICVFKKKEKSLEWP